MLISSFRSATEATPASPNADWSVFTRPTAGPLATTLLLAVAIVRPAAAQQPDAGATGTVVGRIVDPDGSPAAGVRVSVASEQRHTGADGRFRLDAVAEGLHRVVLRHPGLGTDTVQAPVGEGVTTGLVVTYSADGTASAGVHLGGLPASSPSRGSAAEDPGHSRVVGRLLDRSSGDPVASADVILPEVGRGTTTSGDGRFAFDSVPPGRRTVRVHHVRYGDRRAEVEVPGDRTVEVELRLSPQAVEVEPLEVVVDAAVRRPALTGSGYYERRRWAEKAGYGHFLEAEEIEQRGSKLSHVLGSIPQMKASGQVQVRVDGGRTRASGIPYFPRYEEGPFGVCLPAIYLDGQKIVGSGSPRKFVKYLGRKGVNSLVPPQGIAGIEVYESPAATAGEFQASDSRCGVIAIWTKRG